MCTLQFQQDFFSCQWLNRILPIRPNAWKSESHINHVSPKQPTPSKSNELLTDKEDGIYLRNPKLEFIFDNQNGTPVPPPRRHRNPIREKIQAVAKNGLLAFQQPKPVDEPLFVKKIVKPTTPFDDHDCAIRKRKIEQKSKSIGLESKKNLSVVSLPNFEKSASNKASKLETAMTRCRSFGSLLPQQLLGKLKHQKVVLETESDDSFGPLEDWDLEILEHYNPKDASLPRYTARPKAEVLNDVESLIEKSSPPPPPVDDLEHSTLMKILQEFSIKDKQSKDAENEEKKKIVSVEEFLKNEQIYNGQQI